MNSPSVSYVTITEDHAGQRLDNFLLRHLKGLPKSRLYRIIRKGEVRVNKKRCDVDYRLQAGDEVRIPPLRLSEEKDMPTPTPWMQERLENAILFENDQFMVINKPAGLAVHGGSGVQLGLIESLRATRPQQKFLELVHRLDRDTSGCILLAKKASALRKLHELMRSGQIHKKYLALVAGYWPAKLKMIDVPLRKFILQGGERLVKIDQREGKDARTSFRVEHRFANTSLLEVILHTGRTHQIRVHTQYAEHPIIGDDKYGDKAANQVIAKQGFKRLFLHAVELSFVWPDNDEKFTFHAPTDEDWQKAMERLV